MIVSCLHNQSLSQYTTYRVGGNAEKLYLPASKLELMQVISELDVNDTPVIIGGGSNILVSSQGIKGSVILTKNLAAIYLEDSETVVAEAGVIVPKLAYFCFDNGLTGLEFFAGIPGSVGGTVYMNASANGQAVSDTLVSVELFNLVDKTFRTVEKNDLALKYRKSSINPEKDIVISAKFRLKRVDSQLIKEKMDYNILFRKERQPKGFNAGSVFKNPVIPEKKSAGFLLDQVGVKGWKEGGAEVSEKHANFINNVDNATSLDISRLLLRMHQEVKNKTGYILHPEILFIGEPTKEEEEIWKILKEN